MRDEVRHEIQADKIEHDRGQNLMDAAPSLQNSGDDSPKRPCRRSARERQGHMKRRGERGWSQPDCRPRQRPDNHLPLRPDIEKPRPQSERHRQPAEEERGHSCKGLGE